MASNILPAANLWEIASHLENQAGSLRTGIKLMYDQLQVSHSDAEQVSDAISKMYFLTEALDDVRTRLEALSATAFAMHHASNRGGS